MKRLFRFFLFTCILLTAGSSHHLLSFPRFKSSTYASLTAQQNYLSDSKLTPVKPVRDSRVFQLVEDEEDNVTSRVKKSTQYANCILAFFSVSALILTVQSLIKIPLDNRLLAFNSHHRYIQLRTIRI